MMRLTEFKRRARSLRSETYALYLVARDLIPLAVPFALRWIPSHVLAECRDRAGETFEFGKPDYRSSCRPDLAFLGLGAMDIARLN